MFFFIHPILIILAFGLEFSLYLSSVSVRVQTKRNYMDQKKQTNRKEEKDYQRYLLVLEARWPQWNALSVYIIYYSLYTQQLVRL